MILPKTSPSLQLEFQFLENLIMSEAKKSVNETLNVYCSKTETKLKGSQRVNKLFRYFRVAIILKDLCGIHLHGICTFWTLEMQFLKIDSPNKTLQTTR